MSNTEDKNDIKKMAETLRKGSTLTSLVCPNCSSPIFRFQSGDHFCVKCNKKIILVKNEEEKNKIKNALALDKIEATLMMKVQEIQKKIQNEEKPEKLKELGMILSDILENLEKIRKIR